jgi:HK97 family phage prohead protease
MLFALISPMLKPAKVNQMDMRAVLVDGDDYTQRSGESKEVQIKLEAQMPFILDKSFQKDAESDYEYEIGDDDVVIRGPVYVGNSDMLDRHNELVAPDALIKSWGDYQKNPVILYNHSKTYGVIGRMLDVEMGTWDGIKGEVPIGRAVIDGGEKDIVRKIRKGFLRAFSIGFIAKAAIKECKDDETCYMTFTEVDWLETSVVDVPASPNALFNVQKHVLGYEDMGESIAILFEKMPMESPSEEPPAGGDMESPVEESADSGCGCKSHIESDTPETVSGFDSEIDSLKAQIAEMKELLLASLTPSESQKSESENTDSLNTPIDKGIGQQVNQMTDDTLIDTPEEEVIVASEELEVPTEELSIKTEAVEEAEEVVEEAAEEVAEEELPEEVVEEVAEATEEESAGEPTTTEVMIEVVKALANVEARLSTIEGHIKSSEDIDTLKSELASMKAEKEAAEAEASIEAEVAKRVADLVGTTPEVKTVEASPKSLASTGTEVKKANHTRHDPTPTVSNGMNGLAGWLEVQIAKRGA